MFAPKTSKAKTKTAEHPSGSSIFPRSNVEGSQFGRDPVDESSPGVSWDLSKIALVGQENVPLEQEADRAADRVMRMPGPEASVVPGRTPVSRTGAPPIVNEALRSQGRPLDAATRAFMEPRFGHDFSRVRVHDGSLAGNSAQAIRAQAYTVGSDVVFAAGRYAPSSAGGQRLLAHELAHVVQQASTISTPGAAKTIQRAPDKHPGGGKKPETQYPAYQGADSIMRSAVTKTPGPLP